MRATYGKAFPILPGLLAVILGQKQITKAMANSSSFTIPVPAAIEQWIDVGFEKKLMKDW
jgi:hypothetical protein